jgi:hypothetical protein
MSKTRRASPLIEETFMAANFTPSGAMTSTVSASPRLLLALASRACTIFSS